MCVCGYIYIYIHTIYLKHEIFIFLIMLGIITVSSLKEALDLFLPRYHQIHSTVSWRPVLLCERRRTCYCTSLHTHSRGNTPTETTAVLQHSFFRIPVMTLFVARRASPRPRGPAEGRLGLRCYSLLPHIPPEHQISTCCCSRYRSETKTCQTKLNPFIYATCIMPKMSKNANT